jgi:hypothetical protein
MNEDLYGNESDSSVLKSWASPYIIMCKQVPLNHLNRNRRNFTGQT